ncbi:TPA_asm: UL37.4 uORF [Human alphaherpesvirus 1]|nr:TPA_asm: UL37.4 uORF [Human alphaherpesvirus 1]
METAGWKTASADELRNGTSGSNTATSVRTRAISVPGGAQAERGLTRLRAVDTRTSSRLRTILLASSGGIIMAGSISRTVC